MHPLTLSIYFYLALDQRGLDDRSYSHRRYSGEGLSTSPSICAIHVNNFITTRRPASPGTNLEPPLPLLRNPAMAPPQLLGLRPAALLELYLQHEPLDHIWTAKLDSCETVCVELM